METQRIQNRLLTTQELTLSASLAALYIVTTFIPVDAFIGGAAFISLEIVTVPLIAALSRPRVATVTAIVGSLGMAIFRTGTFPVLPFFAMAIPIISITLGSFSFHFRYGPTLSWAYVLLGAGYYIEFSKGTLLWLAPYVIVIASLPLALSSKGPLLTGLLAFYTAMVWQVTLNILIIGIGGLTGAVWAIITPFMFFERTVATVGSFVLIVALKSRLGETLGLRQEVLRR